MSGTSKSSLTLGLLAAACAAACAAGGEGDKRGVGETSGSSGSVAGAIGATGSAAGTGAPATIGATGGAPGTGAPATIGSMGTSGASSGTGGTPDAGAMSDAGDAVDATTLTPETDSGQGPCTGGTLKPGQTTVMIQSGGAMRSYVLHVPPKYDGKTRAPLLIDMHGKGVTAGSQIGMSGWNPKADAVGLVVIYPQGLYNSWNAGPAGCPILMCCCEPAQDNKVDDAAFIRAVVAKTAQDGCIDLKRVYASGLSNGGIMSQWLACDAADLVAAVAPVSGPNMIDCKPSRPVPVLLFRGKTDTTVPFNGGMAMPGGHNWPSAMADFAKWSDLDKCTDTAMPMPTHPLCQIHSQCAGGAEVILCTPNAQHDLYGGAAAQMIGVPDVAWEFFQRHPLP
jgi:polyhydroxybutyrate depolymerase